MDQGANLPVTVGTAAFVVSTGRVAVDLLGASVGKTTHKIPFFHQLACQATRRNFRRKQAAPRRHCPSVSGLSQKQELVPIFCTIIFRSARSPELGTSWYSTPAQPESQDELALVLGEPNLLAARPAHLRRTAVEAS
jgi:hypothetical protein